MNLKVSSQNFLFAPLPTVRHKRVMLISKHTISKQGMSTNQITLVSFDKNVYSNKFSLFLVTKYIINHCFPNTSYFPFKRLLYPTLTFSLTSVCYM